MYCHKALKSIEGRVGVHKSKQKSSEIRRMRVYRERMPRRFFKHKRENRKASLQLQRRRVNDERREERLKYDKPADR